MELLTKVMKYFSMFQSKNVPESQGFATAASDIPLSERQEGAKIAAIAAALHHHAQAKNDVRAKVAAIAAAIHHHEQQAQDDGLLGVAAVVAAIHHHNNRMK